MKKSVILLVIILIILVAIGFYIYYGLSSLPNNELCFQKVQRENSFCETINEEQCKYYQNTSNSILGGGNCRWIEETSLCIGATGGCD